MTRYEYLQYKINNLTCSGRGLDELPSLSKLYHVNLIRDQINKFQAKIDEMTLEEAAMPISLAWERTVA